LPTFLLAGPPRAPEQRQPPVNPTSQGPADDVGGSRDAGRALRRWRGRRPGCCAGRSGRPRGSRGPSGPSGRAGSRRTGRRTCCRCVGVVQVEVGHTDRAHASRQPAAALKLLRRHGCPCSVGKTSPSAPDEEKSSR